MVVPRALAHYLLHVVVAVGLCGLASCRESSSWNRIPLEGRVTLDGTPLDGSVLFRPADDTKGPAVSITVTKGGFAFRAEEGPVAGSHLAVLMGSSSEDGAAQIGVDCEVDVPGKEPFEIDIAFTSRPGIVVPSKDSTASPLGAAEE